MLRVLGKVLDDELIVEEPQLEDYLRRELDVRWRLADVDHVVEEVILRVRHELLQVREGTGPEVRQEYVSLVPQKLKKVAATRSYKRNHEKSLISHEVTNEHGKTKTLC
jgi:hypothetical protein